MTAWQRREKLLAFMARPDWQLRVEGFTAIELVERTQIYEGNGRYDRCFDDLKALEKRGLVERYDGRPARWSV